MSNVFIRIFQTKFWKVIRRCFWIGWWLFGLSTLGWYGLHNWTGDRFLPVRLVTYLMPWLLAGLIPGLAAAGLAHRKWLAITLAGPTLIVVFTFAPLFLPPSTTALASGTSYKIMSYNVWYRNTNTGALAKVIRAEQPDILLLQELSPATAKRLIKELADLYPESRPFLAYEPDMYQGIISRYPITPVNSIYSNGRAQKVIVDTPAGPIAVWNIHPRPPLPWFRQYQQFSALAREIAAVDGPLILGGDFNTTDQSDAYRLVNQHLRNAHWQAGWGFGFTFPAYEVNVKGLPIVSPVIRIDHIFYSHHFFARHAHTLEESGGSDHRPVTATLSLVRSD